MGFRTPDAELASCGREHAGVGKICPAPETSTRCGGRVPGMRDVSVSRLSRGPLDGCGLFGCWWCVRRVNGTASSLVAAGRASKGLWRPCGLGGSDEDNEVERCVDAIAANVYAFARSARNSLYSQRNECGYRARPKPPGMVFPPPAPPSIPRCIVLPKSSQA